jgi:flagellar FliL protein
MAGEKNTAKANVKAEKSKSGSGTNILLIVVIVVLTALIVCGGSFAGYFFLIQKNMPSNNTTTVASSNKNGVADSTYAFSDFLVNLSDKDDKRFLKIKIYLGYNTNKKLDAELKSKDAILRDSINSVLRSKKSTDFTDTGTETLKKDIMDRVNPLLNTGRISEVYFYDILVQ